MEGMTPTTSNHIYVCVSKVSIPVFFYQSSAKGSLYPLTQCRFAAALAQQKIWVMNVVPIHAPDTLPIIFERGLIGIYHDWCESFGTYPRSYDLLHADHLFSRLKNRLLLLPICNLSSIQLLCPESFNAN